MADATNWYLGFDCATKTFAYSIGYIDREGFMTARERLRMRAAAVKELVRRSVAAASAAASADASADAAEAPDLEAVARAVGELDRDTQRFVRVLGGAVRDLAPGRADDDISTVERIRAVKAYVTEHVRPAVLARVPPGVRLRVVVEYQMSANFKARAVAAALITLFAEDDVVIVGPSLKNRVYTAEEGRHCHFAERYKTNYAANKAHAAHNFRELERVMGTEIGAVRPASLRGHIADSFMQLIGFVVYGPTEKADQYF